MKLLLRHSIGISKKYVYLISILFSLVVMLQTTISESKESFNFSIKFIVFFTTNYFFWAVLIESVYGAVKPLQIGSGFTRKMIFTAFLNLLLICTLHLIISNVVYGIYLIFVANQSFLGVSNRSSNRDS